MPDTSPVLSPIHDRWSPRAFASQPVSDADLHALLAAAGRAPSCMNEQPWRYIVARRADAEGFERLLGTLMPLNQRWAKDAGLLILACAATTFASNGQPNRHAWHDVGMANMNLATQATHLGLGVHAMAGFDAQAAATACKLPEGFEAVCVLAVGHVGDASSLPEDLQARETQRTPRRPVAEWAFEGTWGASLA